MRQDSWPMNKQEFEEFEEAGHDVFHVRVNTVRSQYSVWGLLYYVILEQPS